MKLKDAVPYSLCTPRNVPLPLYDKIRVNGVHGRDLQFTCMVVMPKKLGEVRICVDLKPLNESVFERYIPYPQLNRLQANLLGPLYLLS